jgi:hypothetical protein
MAVAGEGLAIVAPEATPVHAVAAGTVGGQPTADAVELRGDGGRRYRYGHLRAGSVTVRQGQRVDAGSIIGAVGGGPSDPACLHLAVVDADGGPINPYELLLGLADPNELGYQASGLGVGVDPEALDLGLGGARPGSSFAAAAVVAQAPPTDAGDQAGVQSAAGGGDRRSATPGTAGAAATTPAGTASTPAAGAPSAAHLLGGEPSGADMPAAGGRSIPAADLIAGPSREPPIPTPMATPVSPWQRAEPEPEPEPEPAPPEPPDEPQEPAVDQSLLASLLAPGAPSAAPPSRDPGQGRGRH